MSSRINFAFFGTDEFAVSALDAMVLKGFIPNLIVTTPDKPVGRHQILTPSPVKVWATERNIPILQPEKLKDSNFLSNLQTYNPDLFVVASYGKIIPREVFNLPKFKTLNIHPSLLPKYRGPAPIEQAILDDEKDTGVTIIEIDAQMDHGPIVGVEQYHVPHWTSKAELEKRLSTIGGNLIAKVIPDWVSGKIVATPQDETLATYTKMIEKSDAEINLNNDAYTNYRKVVAYHPWPGAYFFKEKDDLKIRVKITKASFNHETNTLEIESVVPEGKKEMPYDDFLRGY